MNSAKQDDFIKFPVYRIRRIAMVFNTTCYVTASYFLYLNWVDYSSKLSLALACAFILLALWTLSRFFRYHTVAICTPTSCEINTIYGKKTLIKWDDITSVKLGVTKRTGVFFFKGKGEKDEFAIVSLRAMGKEAAKKFCTLVKDHCGDRVNEVG